MSDKRVTITLTLDVTPFVKAMQQLSAAFAQAATSMAESMAAIGKLMRQAQEPYLVVDDPNEIWATSWREFGRQLVDIVKHEFWMGQGKPERCPGARWVTPEPLRVTSGYRTFDQQAQLLKRHAGLGVSAHDEVARLRRSIEAMSDRA